MASKVLHLIDSAGLYGAERVVLSLLDELRNSQYPGILGCIRKGGDETPAIAVAAIDAGLDVVYFELKRGVDLRGAHAIKSYVERNGIRLIHSHGYKSNILLGLIPLRPFRVLATVHGWAKQTGSIRARAYETADALSLRRMNSIVAVSNAVKRDLVDRAIDCDRVTVIRNGISLKPDSAVSLNCVESTRLAHPSGRAFVVGAIGRLSKVKGFGYLIDAFDMIAQAIPNCRLAIAGEGPLRDELEKQIAARGLQHRVSLAGYQAPISNFLAGIDLFAMPSLSEGLPMALLEAMAFAKPIVASSVGGIPEAVEDGVNGMLVPAGNSGALADAIVAMYKDPQRAAILGNGARKKVEMDFSSIAMAKKYLEHYPICLGTN